MKVKISIKIYDDNNEENIGCVDGEVNYVANSKDGVSAINKSQRKPIVNLTNLGKENASKIKDLLITIADESFMRMLKMGK